VNSVRTDDEMVESACIVISKILGERTVAVLKRLDLLDDTLKIQSSNKRLHVPLKREPKRDEILEIKKVIGREFQVSTYDFPRCAKQPTSIVELLEDRLPPHLLAIVPKAVDIVGDIAVVEVPEELEEFQTLIGEAIIKVHKPVKTVLAKTSPISGEHRTRSFKVIAGLAKTETLHREHGCVFHVDLAKAYFSPRLSYEHQRVASLVEEGETVVDMFAGVGPFSILIAKKHEHVKVYAIDLNPAAIDLLKKNIVANHVEGKVVPLLGDALGIVERRLLGVADRVIMNLPEKAVEFVKAACKAVKPEGGIIHFYCFAKAPDPLGEAQLKFVKAVQRAGKEVEKIFVSRLVRATAPHTWQVVVDAKIG